MLETEISFGYEWVGVLRSIIWLCPIVLLIIALLDMLYGYYQLLRVGVFCASAYLAVQEKGQGSKFWLWAFIACALRVRLENQG